MNFLYVGRQLGLLLIVMSVSVLATAAWAFARTLLGDASEIAPLRALLTTVSLGGVLGGALWFAARRCVGQMGRREALLLVALSWLIGAALAALPYRLWVVFDATSASDHSPFASFVNCYFEAMSGLTTTGASVLSDIESLPRSLLLWRSLTQWLGGLGIVVLFVAVLPMLGVGGKRLFRVEAPGPTPEGVTPRIQEAARALWIIYLALTAASVVTMKLLGMSWFDSTCHTFTALATGGFSTQNASIGSYDSVAIDLAVVVFMILAGINFGLYYQCLRRGWRSLLRDPELKWYLGILGLGTVILAVAIHGQSITTTSGREIETGLGDALRYGVFQAVSAQTTTGFCTADFNGWGFVAKWTILILMFVGASAGSTGGGIKVIRCLTVFKVLWAEIEHVFRPQVVRAVKIGASTIDAEMKLATLVYVLVILLITLGGTSVLLLLEQDAAIDVTTAFSATVATLNNIGPGLARVGAVENYGWFGDASKWVLSVLMVLGRLEVFTIAVLVYPRFWRSE
ncbi:MAG: TrkH family potassium uptake protein [Planctomycetes bacterium]|nr:TrkH family potassium uptake protein [Planctomycetota bacterium]